MVNFTTILLLIPLTFCSDTMSKPKPVNTTNVKNENKNIAESMIKEI